MLKFGFNNNNLQLTQEEFEKAKEQAEKGFGKYLEEGTHEVKITEAEFSVNAETGSCMCEKDPTWGKVRITLTDASDRSINHTVLVPTSSLKYGESKGAHFPFIKFTEFMAALGENVKADAKVMSAITKKYFADLKKLVGKEMKIDVGYKGPHLKFVEKGKYQIVKADGSQLIVADYESRELALLAASDLPGVKLEKFPGITKFYGAEIKPVKAAEPVADAPAAAPVADDGW